MALIQSTTTGGKKKKSAGAINPVGVIGSILKEQNDKNISMAEAVENVSKRNEELLKQKQIERQNEIFRQQQEAKKQQGRVNQAKQNIASGYLTIGSAIAQKDIRPVGSTYEDVANKVKDIYNNPMSYVNDREKVQNILDTAISFQPKLEREYIEGKISKDILETLTDSKYFNSPYRNLDVVTTPLAELENLGKAQDNASSVLKNLSNVERENFYNSLEGLDARQIANQFELLGAQDDNLLQRIGNTASNIGKDFVYSVANAGRAVTETIKDITGDSTDTVLDQQLDRFKEQADLDLKKAIEGADPFTSTLLQASAGVGQFALLTALTGGNTGLALKLSTGLSGSSAFVDAEREGYDFETSALYGLAIGATNYFVEKLPFENIGNILSKGSHGIQYIIASTASQAFSEGMEEGVQYIAEQAINNKILGKDFDFSGQDLMMNMFLGAIGGGMMGGLTSSVQTVRNKRQYNYTKQNIQLLSDYLNNNDVSVEERATFEQVIRTAESAMQEYQNRSVIGDAVQFESDQIPNLTYNQVLDAMARIDSVDAETNIKAQELLYNSQRMLNARGINMDAVSFANLDEDTKQQVLNIQDSANELGAKVKFDTNASEAGHYDPNTGEILINPLSKNGSLSVFMHELTHSVEGSQYYSELGKLLTQTYGDDVEQAKRVIKDRYAQSGENLSDEGVDQEFVAIQAQESLADENFVKRLVNYNSSLAYRLYEGIRNLTKSSSQASQIEYNFLKAFRDVDPTTLKNRISNSRIANYFFGENAQQKTQTQYFLDDNNQEIQADLQNNRNEVLSMEPVVEINNSPLAIKNEIPPIKKITEYFQNNYGGKTYVDGIGEVVLDKKAVKDDYSHGNTPLKFSAYEGVVPTLQNGLITDIQNQYKNKAEDRMIISAPVRIDGVDYIENVVLRQTGVTTEEHLNRLYVHDVSVIQKNGNTLLFRNSDLGIQGTRATDTAYEYNISNNGQNVKNSIDLSNEDLSLDSGQKNGKINTEVNYETDDFRRLQEESRELSKRDDWFKTHQRVDEELRHRLSNVLRRELEHRANSNGNAYGLLDNTGDFKIYSNVDGQTFRDMFEIARLTTENGELVDLHDVETTDDHGIGYKYCKNYLTDDGMSGFSITPDGDLVSVFNAGTKRGFLRSISNYIKSDAKTLDCYASPNQPLNEMYEKVFGFKVASTMDYNMEYDHDNIALNHGEPQVAFMVNTDQDVKTRHFNKDQYDEAVEYRNSFIKDADAVERVNEGRNLVKQKMAEMGDNYSYEAIMNDQELLDTLDSIEEISKSFEETINDTSKARLKIRKDIFAEYLKKEVNGKSKDKKAFIILGPPGSGKSSVVAKRLLSENNAVEVDSDKVKEMLPEFKQYGGIYANAVHQESSDIGEYVQEHCTSEGYNMVLPLVGKNTKKITNLIKNLKENGYTISIYDVALPTEKSISRAVSRFAETGRFLPISYLRAVGNSPDITYDAVKNMEEVDYYAKYSNDVPFGQKAILLDEGRNREDGRRNGNRAREEIRDHSQTSGNDERNGNDGRRDFGRTTEPVYGQSIVEEKPISTNNIPEGETIRENKQDTGKYFKQGENPDRDVKVEKETAYGNTNRFARTEAESQNLSDEQVELLQAEIGKGKFAYNPVSNKTLVDNANSKLDKMGIDKMYENYIENHNQSARSIAEGELLLQQLAKSDSEKALKVASIVAGDLTEAGRAVQSARIFKRLSPEGKLLSVEQARNRIQEQLDARYGKGVQEINIDDNLKQDLLNAKTQEEADEAVTKIEEEIAKQMPSDVFDKMNAWRYFAMLANPRTHIRNILGNAVFAPIIDTKNFIGSAVETIVSKVNPKFERVKTSLNPLSQADKALVGFGKTDYENYKSKFEQQGKYAIDEAIKNKRTYFKDKGIGKIANKLISKSSDLLDAEDLFFSKNRYAKSLAEYLKSHGVTAEQASNPPSEAILDIVTKGQEYAYQESLKATYRDDSKIAKKIAELENTNKFTRFIFGGIMPFKKTPINIVKRGIEYSPAGLVKALYNGAFNLKNGKITANDLIDQLSAGLAGSGILMLGMFLASKGILRTNDDDSDRKERFDSDMGSQDYSLVFPFGSYTIDWLSPSIMPLAMGVELFNLSSDETADYDLGNIADAFMRLADPITETSMLKNASDILTQYGENGTQKLGALMGDVVVSYINQFFPTLGGQVARTIDDTRRTTYPNEGFFDSFARQLMNKIPGASFLNEPYVNRHGETEKQEDLGLGAVGRLVLNMISPGYYNSNLADEYDDEYYRLYDQTGNLDAFPTNSTNKFSADGIEYELSPKDYTKYQQEKWSKEKQMVDEFIDSDIYDDLSDQEKVDIIGKIRSYNSSKTKYEYLAGKGVTYSDPTVEKVESALEKGLPVYEYFMADSFYKGLSGNSKQSDYIDYLNSLDVSDSEKNALYDAQYGDSASTIRVNDFADDYGLSDSQEMGIKRAMTTQSLKDANGETIRNSKALQVRNQYEEMGIYDDVLDYISKNGLDAGDFGLNKTVVGYSDSKFNYEYSSLYGSGAKTGTQSSGSSRSSRRSGSRSRKVKDAYGVSEDDYNKAIQSIDNIYSKIQTKIYSNANSFFDIEIPDIKELKIDISNELKLDTNVKDLFKKYSSSMFDDLIDSYLEDHPYSNLFEGL